MTTSLKAFLRDQSGAVTVDWVVLTAAIIGIGMVVIAPIAMTTDSTANATRDYILTIPVGQ